MGALIAPVVTVLLRMLWAELLGNGSIHRLFIVLREVVGILVVLIV